MTIEQTLTDKPLRVRDVFVPGGFPQYTYQKREKHDVEGQLVSALDRVNKFIAVAGPTKSGKTVLVRRMVPKGASVWVEGGHISSVQDVWNAILADLSMPVSVVESQLHQAEDAYTLEVTTGFKPVGIGADIKNLDSTKTSNSTGTAATYGTAGPKAATNALMFHEKVLVIDDFHYLDEGIQTSLIRALKPAVFDGLRVVLLLIPHRMHQAAQAEMDVDGRTHTIYIPDWQGDELFSIAESGFKALNIKCHAQTTNALINECFGSPHLMQDFCSTLCSACKIQEQYLGTAPIPIVAIPQPTDSFFKGFAKSISPETFKALRRGPERTNRKERAMSAGGTCDTYEAVLLALHELGGATPVDWSALRRALQTVLAEVPQQHEVTRALEKMDEIAKERKGEPVIDYMKNQGELHLVDPFFRYYLKWNTAILDDSKP